jgi:hypothetical protein
MPNPPAARFAAAALLALSACSSAPSPSHVSGTYKGKLPDDTMVEMSTTELVTRRDVVVALDCKPLAAAIAKNDSAAIDREKAGGNATRLPARVTLYTPPFSAQNPATAPIVVTDDKYGGILCTPESYDVVKS